MPGCEENLIIVAAREKYWKLFGIDVARMDENEMPRSRHVVRG
jgi:hypothetical protein